MMLFLKIAWQNMRSHWKQTLTIIFAVAASEFMLVFISSMMEGIKASFYTSLVRENGHLQIHAAGWKDKLEPASLKVVMPNATALVAAIAEQPGVAHAEASLMVSALAIAGGKNLGMMVIGTTPASFFYHQAREGIRQGQFLPGGAGIALSESAAHLLGVSLGDSLNLLTQDADGNPWYISRPITGLFATRSLEFDQRVLLISPQTAADLSGLDDMASEIRVDLADPDAADAIRSTLATGVAAGHEISTWREINGSMLAFIDVFDYLIIGFDILLILVAGTVITNAVLMSVFARSQELGTLRAIGLKRRGLRALILTEGSQMGLIGSLIGLVIALPLVLHFQANGLSFGDGQMTDAFGLGNRIDFVLRVGNVARDLIAGTLIAVAAAGYAGAIISRRTIIDTLKQA